jgi:Ferritin-like domain
MHATASRQPTRRQLLSGAIAGAGLGSVAAAMLATSDAAAASDSDADLLHAILSVELLVVFCYQQVLQSETLALEAEPPIRHLLGHEQTHVAVITSELEKLGQAPPPGPTSVAGADAELDALHARGGLASLHSEQDSLRLLEGAEQLAQGAYYKSISKLTDPRLARLCASILGSEAQHYAVLGDLLHPGEIDKAVPAAFVEGTG